MADAYGGLLGNYLDGLDENQQRMAISSGLLGLGSSLLANQYVDPRTGQGGIGAGFAQGAQQMAAIPQQIKQQAYQDAAMKQKLAQQKAMQDMMASLPEDQRQVAMMNPEAYAKARAERMFAEAKAPTTRTFKRNGEDITQEFDPNTRSWVDLGTSKPDWTNPDYVRTQMAIRAAGRPSVSINQQVEGEQAKLIGGYYGGLYTNLQKASTDSLKSDADLNRMSQLMGLVQTGKIAPALAEAQAWGESLGLDLGKAGPAEALNAISNKLALGQRQDMPGAMSDADRSFLVNMTPGLRNTPEGNAILIETQRRLNARSRDMAKLAREYRSKNGGVVDDGLQAELEAFAARKPLFSDLAAKVNPASDPVKDALKSKYGVE
jgi:hypothetical protein